MSQIMNIASIVLNVSGILFAAAYIFINLLPRMTDVAERNKTLTGLCNFSLYTSLTATLLACLLNNTLSVEEAIARASGTYSVISVCWMIVLALCSLALLVTLVTKKLYRREASAALQAVNKIAVKGALLGMILSWLFS